jgi:hypothetical protein
MNVTSLNIGFILELWDVVGGALHEAIHTIRARVKYLDTNML